MLIVTGSDARKLNEKFRKDFRKNYWGTNGWKDFSWLYSLADESKSCIDSVGYLHFDGPLKIM